MSLKDLTAKIKEDAAFAENFKGLASVDAIVAKAKELGFELTDEDINKLSQVSPEDLEKAAGGMTIIVWKNTVIVTEYE